MKKLVLCLTIPMLLGACSSRLLPTQELRAIKPACAGGDAAVCSDIGQTIHDMRLADQQAGVAG